jgi:hypothetical protein
MKEGVTRKFAHCSLAQFETSERCGQVRGGDSHMGAHIMDEVVV